MGCMACASGIRLPLLLRPLYSPTPLHQSHPCRLKKFAKNVGGATNEPVPGFLTLEIEHPDDPGEAII